jgi:hypothetical protein
MVEVFKTNISKRQQANQIINWIGQSFPAYRASFDLEDCDKVLRVTSASVEICPLSIISFLQSLGHHAEVLPDDLSYLPSVMELGFQPFQTHES